MRSAANLTSKPPEPLVFFVDESLDSQTVVDALRSAGATVERSIEHFGRGAEDQVWLRVAGHNGWVVLTRDKRITQQSVI
jgi:PIN like domain